MPEMGEPMGGPVDLEPKPALRVVTDGQGVRRGGSPGWVRWLAGGVVALAVLALWGYEQPEEPPAMFAPLPSTTVPTATSWATEWTRITDWARTPDDEAVFARANYEWINDVTSGGPGLVAVGAAAVWTSPDGYEWSVALFGDPIEDEAQGWIVAPFEMRSVTATESGLYAVGEGFFEYPYTEEEDWIWGSTGLVLTSPDGTNWTAVPDLAVFADAELHDIVEGGPGLVTVGRQLGLGAYGLPTELAAVWVSTDGATWTRADVPDSGDSVIAGVTVGGPGLVAVGLSDEGHEPDAAVWTSQDGTVWDRVPHDETMFGGPGPQMMSSVTVGGPGLVAVGGDRGRAAVWTSPDGSTWTRIPHDDAIFGALPDWGPGSDPRSTSGFDPPMEFDPPMKDVIATDAGLVAVGGQILGVEHIEDVHPARVGSAYAAIVWTSPDGSTWSRISTEADAMRNSVAEGGPGLISVGSHQRQAIVWVARP